MQGMQWHSGFVMPAHRASRQMAVGFAFDRTARSFARLIVSSPV